MRQRPLSVGRKIHRNAVHYQPSRYHRSKVWVRALDDLRVPPATALPAKRLRKRKASAAEAPRRGDQRTKMRREPAAVPVVVREPAAVPVVRREPAAVPVVVRRAAPEPLRVPKPSDVFPPKPPSTPAPVAVTASPVVQARRRARRLHAGADDAPTPLRRRAQRVEGRQAATRSAAGRSLPPPQDSAE